MCIGWGVDVGWSRVLTRCLLHCLREYLEVMEEEERSIRRHKQNERNLRAQMTEEQLAKYKEQRRENERKRQAKMTEEQLAERRIKRRHNEKNRLARMTVEELAERRDKRSQQARERRQRIKERHLQTCDNQQTHGQQQIIESHLPTCGDQQTDDQQQIEIIAREDQIANDEAQSAETIAGHSDGNREQSKKNEINQSTHMSEQKLIECKAWRRQNERKRLAQMTEDQSAKRREGRRQQEKQRRQQNRGRHLQIVSVPQVRETIATKDNIVNNQGLQNLSNQHVPSTEEQQPSCGEQNMQNQKDQSLEKSKETLVERRARRRQNERNRLAKMTEEQLAARRERRRQQTQQRRLRHRQRRLQNASTPQFMESTVASEGT